MAIYTRREALGILGTGIAVTGLGLVGCGNSNSGSATSTSASSTASAPATQGLASILKSSDRTLWFRIIKTGFIEKDDTPTELLVLQGGQVTSYNGFGRGSLKGTPTFGDISKMGDDDVISAFAKAMQDAYETGYAVGTNTYATYYPDGVTELNFHIPMDITSADPWEAPTPQDATLAIETTGSGNATKSETLSYKHMNAVMTTTGEDGTISVARRYDDAKEKVLGTSTTSNIYDANFAGFAEDSDGSEQLVTKVSGSTTFVMDQPGTEGVTVD